MVFLCHALRREVGGLDEGEEDVQRFLKMVGAVEEVAGLVKGGESVGICAGLGVEVEYVAVLVLKKLVLQKMGDFL